MNLQENIHRIKEVMGLVSELNIKRKSHDSGSYKNVYFSENNPDIVYKVSDLGALQYEQAIFGKYPDLFCNPIGEPKKMSETISRTKGNGEKFEDDVYYLAYEKLDTEKYMSFYRNMEDTFENNVNDEIKKEAEEKGWIKKIPNEWGTNDYFEFCIYNICTDPDKMGAVKLFNTMAPIVKQENPNYYNNYLQFIDLLYKITSLEEYDSDLYWDFNYGNFGYDKTGKIKCLDI
jgi:dipeptidase